MTKSPRFASSPRSWLPTSSGRPDETGEQGAVLIIALILLVVGAIITGALSYQVTNDLHSSVRFKAVRSLQYAARSATDLGIQNIRYVPLLGINQTLNASPPSACWGSGPASTVSNVDGVAGMTVWCSTVWVPTSAYTRTVTLSTCLTPKTAITTGNAPTYATACAANPLLQAVVSFDDYPPGISAPTASQCATYCGTTMFTNSWVWSPNVPTLTGVSPSTGPILGGTTVTVTGTGFDRTDTGVTLVEESGGAPATDNMVLTGSAVAVNASGTSLTFTTPAATEGSTYFVEVTTPHGSTPQGAASVFTYTNTVAPTLTGISPTAGAITGQTVVTLTGTNFFAGSIVKFAQESGGVATYGTNGACGSTGIVCGTVLSVISPTSMTVISPAVTTAGTYFVVVKTTAGQSATTTNGVFTYSAEVPTVSSVSPSSGPDAGGTAIVISGTGFITGTTVSFSKVSSGCTATGALTPSNVVIVGPNTITANTPAVSAANQYYVFVTSPLEGASGCYPVFTYTG